VLVITERGRMRLGPHQELFWFATVGKEGSESPVQGYALERWPLVGKEQVIDAARLANYAAGSWLEK
jgi:hypothetical protein